ncbi:hypothetical protein K503DRAFT_857449 [Rhizopogon vinicolor AM-OR11-026]|uniref:F-box domain-containing protein n=1 Tax=Rhizopogon vinicolor AM-OR11-026 TaxID=1314800 RepID=A0A1B7MXJ0_9AGAM|nr:hypothetical protein K503DRAFT_857449 [Rhizopogon vinicolor AM-OR11-026]
MEVGFLSIPAELICHILLFLSPTDICHCATTCKTVWRIARKSVHVQYELEIYAQGFMETATLSLIDSSTKLSSLKKLSSLWRSNYWHAKTVFEEVVNTVHGVPLSGVQSVKCGIWWMWAQGNLFIRDCNANAKLSRTWPTNGLSVSTQHLLLCSVIVDPLQDLVIALSSQTPFTVVDAGQDYRVFLVEFRLASSHLPYPDSACASLECRHVFDAPGHYSVYHVNEPAVCGDRVVILYYMYPTQDLFIQVIDWRKGHAKSYPLREKGGGKTNFHLVDERTIIVVGEDGLLSLYTLRELDGSPQHQITYLLPGMRYYHSLPYYVIHTTPSFHNTATHPDLMPGYVPSLESQIMVLEVLSDAWPVILVIDMNIFSEQAIHSEMPVEVPWSDWGPRHTCCFPHHPSHRISVFGSKMAYALPVSRTPEPGERLEGFSVTHEVYDGFRVHIWDFNKRVIARAKNDHDRNARGLLVRKPGRLVTSCLVGKSISDRTYTATVCRTNFQKPCFDRLFLEQDQLILTWSRAGSLRIQVVCPDLVD